MRVRTISISLKRDVRHIRYNVSQCRAELTVDLEEGEDLLKAYQSVKEDVTFMVEDLAKEEKENFRKQRGERNE